MQPNQTKSSVLLNATNIYLSFNHQQILDGVDIAVHSGEVVTLVGPNGAGKSCLVKVVLGLMKPNQGAVVLKPNCIVGYTPQRIHIDYTLPLTVLRFLKLTDLKRDIDEVLQEVGITHLANCSIQKLSGGEMQRVLLARALLRKPDLLVLDEPAQGVDIAGQDELYRLIGHIRDKYNCGVLLVSHDLSLVMAKTDTVVCLNQHVCCSGCPEDVSQDPKFLSLFGLKPGGLAFYTHHHDHHHTVEGEVVSINLQSGDK